VSYFLRRLPLSRLLLLCGVLVVAGVGATALATALGTGPTPAPKPLAEAVHDALTGAQGQPIEGVSARIQFTNHLLEGAGLAGGNSGGADSGGAGSLASSPLVTGASGRLWISKDGHVRLELQSEKGDTEVLYDGHTVTVYDAASNTLYRYTPPAPPVSEQGAPSGGAPHHEVPSVAKVEEAIAHISQHADLSGATPTDVGGQPAYTVRISPSHNGGLIGGAELSFDAVHGVPLRAAIYAAGNPSPAIELAATEISYEPVPASIFEITPPAGTKVQEVSPHKGGGETPPPGPSAEGSKPFGQSPQSGGSHPKLTTHGTGLEAIAVLESPVKQEGSAGKPSPTLPEGLQKVQIDGATASELPTALGTLLSFERSGVRYVLAGSVTPAAIEAFARGL
jgi:outer membrane lipoprotein-sorting protein